MWIILHVLPLNFHDFSLISNTFINIHEYANLIICIPEHWMKVLCLKIQLVPSLKVSDELLLKMSTFVGTSPFLRSALSVAMEIMRFHISHIGLFFRAIFSPFRWYPKTNRHTLK